MKRAWEEQAGYVLRLAETLFAMPEDFLPSTGVELVDDPSVAMEALLGRCLGRLAAPAGETGALGEAGETRVRLDAAAVRPAPGTANTAHAFAGTAARGAAAAIDFPSGAAAASVAGRRAAAQTTRNSVGNAAAALAVRPTPPATDRAPWPAPALATDDHRASQPARARAVPDPTPAGGPRASGSAGRHLAPPSPGTSRPADETLRAAQPGTGIARRKSAGEAFSPSPRVLPDRMRAPELGDARADRQVLAPATEGKRADISLAGSGRSFGAAHPPRSIDSVPATGSLPPAPNQPSPTAVDGYPPGGRSTRLLAGVGDLNHLFAAVVAERSAPVRLPREGAAGRMSDAANRLGTLPLVASAGGSLAPTTHLAPGAAIDHPAARPAADGSAEPAAFARSGASPVGVVDPVAEDLLFERLLERWEERLREQSIRQFGLTGGLI